MTRRRRLNYTLALGDVALTIVALGLTYLLLGAAGAATASPHQVFAKLASVGWIFAASQVAALYVLGLYSPRKAPIDWRYTGELALAIASGAALTSGLLFFVPGFVIGRQPLLLNLPILFALLFTWRYSLFRFASKDTNRVRIALAGGEPAVLSVIDDIARQSHPDYAVTSAYLSERSFAPSVESTHAVELASDFDKFLEARDIQAVAVDLHADWLTKDQIERLIVRSFEGVEFHDLATLHTEMMGRVPRAAVTGRQILDACSRVGRRGAYWRAKRLSDIAFATAGLVVAALPILVVAALVKATSKGPVFFVQERLGFRRRPFECIKFRTMLDDAERHTGPVWSSDHDSRITSIGGFLRSSRLDELPQLWNVLCGDMALVGPRPIRAYFADLLAKEIPFYDIRFTMRPGLTGWAQVNQNYAGSTSDQETKFRYELFYLENFSLVMDAYILLKTVRTIVKRRGS